MASSGGEHLAPVTYLFGAPAPQEAEQVSPPEEPSRVAFRDESAPAAVGRPAADALPSEPSAFSEPLDERGRFQRINNVSMNALARRGMSAEEMSAYLLGRGFDEGEVELECERLLGVALLDDAALAETLVRSMRERKGLGRSAIVAELKRRKLDASAIEGALEELGDDELDRAIAIAEKRASQLRSLDSETAKRRLSAFLMRKGYSSSVISTAVSRALTPSGPVFR